MKIEKGRVRAVKKGQDDGLLKVNMKNVTVDKGVVVEEEVIKDELNKENEVSEFLSKEQNIYKNGYDKGFTHGAVLAFIITQIVFAIMYM